MASLPNVQRIHPMECDCAPCRAPRRRTLVAPSVLEPGDVAAIKWGFIHGAIACALLLLNHFGPAIVAAVTN